MFYIKTAEGWKPWAASYKVCDNHNDLQGVFTNTSVKQVQSEMSVRSDRFLDANSIQSMIEKQRYFRGDHFIEPLFGAFGEKL